MQAFVSEAGLALERSRAQPRDAASSRWRSPRSCAIPSQRSFARTKRTRCHRYSPLLSRRRASTSPIAVWPAATVGAIAGAAPAAMTAAVESFHGLEHAMEFVADIDGVRFVNDSKATNVEAARRSIESFDSGVVAIIGGRYKGGDFGDLRGALASRGRAVVAIGEAAGRVREALEGTVPVIDATSMAEAVQRGYDAAGPDGVVLLAPACSSFDWFRDYAERGEVFKEEVRGLRGRIGERGMEDRKQ